jgi:hypothetical protein
MAGVVRWSSRALDQWTTRQKTSCVQTEPVRGVWWECAGSRVPGLDTRAFPTSPVDFPFCIPDDPAVLGGDTRLGINNSLINRARWCLIGFSFLPIVDIFWIPFRDILAIRRCEGNSGFAIAKLICEDELAPIV